LSRSLRSGLGDKVTNRTLEPFAGRIAAKIDPDHQRQAGQEKPIRMPLPHLDFDRGARERTDKYRPAFQGGITFAEGPHRPEISKESVL
jgi:hypothetical protein